MTEDLLNEVLYKIDILRDRTGLNFSQARHLLEEHNWDVMEALISYEQQPSPSRLEAKGRDVVSKVKHLIKQGNVTNIRVRANDRIVMELPVTMGLVSAVLVPKLALLAGLTCLLTKCTIEFDQLKNEQ